LTRNARCGEGCVASDLARKSDRRTTREAKNESGQKQMKSQPFIRDTNEPWHTFGKYAFRSASHSMTVPSVSVNSDCTATASAAAPALSAMTLTCCCWCTTSNTLRIAKSLTELGGCFNRPVCSGTQSWARGKLSLLGSSHSLASGGVVAPPTCGSGASSSLLAQAGVTSLRDRDGI
jgi:hypothetical protein